MQTRMVLNRVQASGHATLISSKPKQVNLFLQSSGAVKRHTKEYTSGRNIQPRAAIEDSTPSDAEVISPISSRLLPSADERYSGMKVLVAGASGGVGRAVVAQLAEMGIPVRAMVRDAVKASSKLPSSGQGVEIVEGNVYKFQDVARAVKGCTAIIIATGPTDRLNVFGPFEVDYRGNENIAAAAVKEGIKKVVLVTSIGADDPLFPLNLFWGVLFWKKQGELALQRSGIDYTVVRPGGLMNEPRRNQKEGGVVMAGADAFGLPPRRRPGSILRKQVAECCISALVDEGASNKVVEIIAQQDVVQRPWSELFQSVN